MLRTSTLSLTKVNMGKLTTLDSVLEEAKRVVNEYINVLWEQKEKAFEPKYKYIDFKVDTWLSSAMLQCLGRQALAMVKPQRLRKKKTKPVFTKDVIVLRKEIVDFQFDNGTSFDAWVRLKGISNKEAGDKIVLKLPAKKHYHFNKYYKKWSMSKSPRLRKQDGHYFIDCFFDTIEPRKKDSGKDLGVDIGYKKLLATSDGETYGKEVENLYEKIARKKQGSKAFKKALVERNHTVNRTLKKLPLESVKTIVVEDLKNVKHKTKGKIRKRFNSKLQRWTYARVLIKLSYLCEENGIKLVKVNPAYTSQTCSECGTVDKNSRQGEQFLCTACGVSLDADINAAKNILHRGVYRPPAEKGKVVP